ncbi:gephyrin-like molybdotransferase Glp [Gordonia sp. DT30]|uniref:molybdopterin molybdotransferase MoeA n=1 Tax=unclassified Gordonia (in: high G+C Gram-positive bacteria) TaxID=2657482 RepID=UPI003CFA197F
MRTVTEHQRVVAALFPAPEPVILPVPAALGRVTAVDIAAPISLPGFDNSAMDGFAVRAADVAAASTAHPVRLPVAADIPAGRVDPPPLAPHTAHRIMTGAPMPRGADAVVPVELTTSTFMTSTFTDSGDVVGTEVTITAAVPPGKHLRPAGSDIVAGEPALPAGSELGAPQIGLLCSLGLSQVSVLRTMRVAVLSTGSELVAPGMPLRHGQIHESNGAMLTASAIEAGASATHVHFVPDDTTQFRHRLDEIAADADLIITSGGVSAGAFEVVKEALGMTGGVEFVKVAMQPGMPQGCGHYRAPNGRTVPIVTLPGNPVSSLVSFEVFIRDPLRAAMGLRRRRERLRARLHTDLTSPAGKRQFQRAIFLPDPHGPRVTTVGPPASHHLSNLARAEALVDIPAETVRLTAGDEVDVIRLR